MNTKHHNTKRSAVRQRGIAAVLSMMFLVIFASLAAAMAIVSQGNLATADSHLKINRSLAAAETGMNFLVYRLSRVTKDIRRPEGVIDATVAEEVWDSAGNALRDELAAEPNTYDHTPTFDGKTLHIPRINIAAGAPSFEATFTQHPLPGEDYDAPYYQRPPYSGMSPAVSSTNQLGPDWIRLKVIAADGIGDHAVYRSISVDLQITKRIPYAILSKNRVMIGRNVMIDGPIGSQFMETHLEHGHPVQMVSDFRGLQDDLDGDLDAFTQDLITNDKNGDNRLSVNSSAETDGIADPKSWDRNNDGFIDEYDIFLGRFDTDGVPGVSKLELETHADSLIEAHQLLELIDTFGDQNDPNREGWGDEIIDDRDRYTKLRGEVYVKAPVQGWNDGAAGGNYQSYFQGPISPGYERSPLTFQADANDVYEFQPSDFDVATFRAMATGDMATQASGATIGHTREAVPFGAAHPYDYYNRQIYEGITFTDVTIPVGTNALFKNCTFIGVTFVETDTANTDPNFNFGGMVDVDGNYVNADLADTKAASNNLRFDGCTFEGGIVTDAPQEFTHVRNKLAFTGTTKFNIDDSIHLNEEEKRLFKRSTILAPHYSVEMGTFVSPHDNSETVELSGTIVAGVLDMRGQVKVKGTILTTFEPKSNTGPVIGDTSPQFNTTLGYFSADTGDLEAELPANGIGVIQVTYDPTLPLPDGVTGPVQIEPVVLTYSEGGK